MDIIHWFSDHIQICIFPAHSIRGIFLCQTPNPFPFSCWPSGLTVRPFFSVACLAHACNIRDRSCCSIFDRLNTYRQRDLLRNPGAVAAQYPSVLREFRHNFFGIIFTAAERKARTLMKAAGASDFSGPEYFIDGNRFRSRIPNQQNEIILCYYLLLII